MVEGVDHVRGTVPVVDLGQGQTVKVPEEDRGRRRSRTRRDPSRSPTVNQDLGLGPRFRYGGKLIFFYITCNF